MNKKVFLSIGLIVFAGAVLVAKQEIEVPVAVQEKDVILPFEKNAAVDTIETTKSEAASVEKRVDVARDVTQAEKRVVVDKILARVNGENVLLSDLNQPRIDSDESFTLETLIDQRVMYQKAVERKLQPTTLEIEKQIEAWKEAHNLVSVSEAEMEKRLRADGLSMAKYRAQLERVLAVRNLKQLEISERIVVTARDVENYHNENPGKTEDRYLLQTKIIPFRLAATEEDAEKQAVTVPWIDVDWLNKSQLSEQMAFVPTMKAGDVSKVLRVPQGYQIVKLVQFEASREKVIAERWNEIESILMEQKRAIFEREYVGELRKRATIVYVE